MSFTTYSFYDYTPEEITSLTTNLVALGMPTELSTPFANVFNVMGTNKYRTFLINDTITRTQSVPILAWNVWQYMSRYSNILNKFKTEATQLSTLKESQIEETQYGKVEDEELRNMNEDAPITSDATDTQGNVNYAIDTPKTRYNANNTRTNSGSDTITKDNPYYWEMFLRLLEKYNINNILLNSLKYITYEYNSVN